MIEECNLWHAILNFCTYPSAIIMGANNAKITKEHKKMISIWWINKHLVAWIKYFDFFLKFNQFQNFHSTKDFVENNKYLDKLKTYLSSCIN